MADNPGPGDRIRELEARLAAEKNRSEAVLSTAADAIICLAQPGVITLWNWKASEMFGYKKDEVLGKALHDVIVPERYRERAASALKRFFDTGKGRVIGRTIEIEALRKDGVEFPVELSVSAFEAGGAWNALGIIRDITGRKALEAESRRNLEEAERMNRLMVGRELKMEELRREMQRLKQRLAEVEAGAASRAGRGGGS